MGNTSSSPAAAEEDNVAASEKLKEASEADEETLEHDDSISTGKETNDTAEAVNVPEMISEMVADEGRANREQRGKVDTMLQPVPGSIPAEQTVSGPFDWDSLSVERQAEHYLFLLGMILALAELGDGVGEERCNSEKLTDFHKELPSTTQSKDLIDIAVNTADEKDIFKEDPMHAERPYPRAMWQQWRSWIANHKQSLFADDMYLHEMKQEDGVLYAICISHKLNSITVVLGYNKKNPDPDSFGMKKYEIERNSGRSVGVDASFGDVLAGTEDNETTLVAHILQEIAQQTMKPLIRLSVVGYSGGGALASVLGLVLACAREEPICVWSFGVPAVWSFGGPAVGDARFQETHSRLEGQGKLRHVSVETSLRRPLPGRHYPVGVPLTLHSRDHYARKRLWKALKSYVSDGKRQEGPLQQASLKECFPGMKPADYSISDYWRSLMATETADGSMEEWYQNAPLREKEKQARFKKQVSILVILVVALVAGSFLLKAWPVGTLGRVANMFSASETPSYAAPEQVLKETIDEKEVSPRGRTGAVDNATDVNDENVDSSESKPDSNDTIETAGQESLASASIPPKVVDESASLPVVTERETTESVENEESTLVETPSHGDSAPDSPTPEDVDDKQDDLTKNDEAAQALVPDRLGFQPRLVSFSNRFTTLSRASLEVLQQMSFMMSTRTSNAAVQHVVKSWEAQYWYSKHHSRFDALNAIQELHDKLVKSVAK